jgi:hypothetical protein
MDKLEELERIEKGSKPKTAIQLARQADLNIQKIKNAPKKNPIPNPIKPVTKIDHLEEDSDPDDMDLEETNELEEISSIDFVSASAKDLKEIDEQTAQNEVITLN